MTENKSRFVLLCQQALACAVVVLLAAPAVGVGTLDLVAPDAGGRGVAPAQGPGSLVSAEPAQATVTQVQLTEGAAADNSRAVLTDEAARLDVGRLGADPAVAGEVTDPSAAARSLRQPVHGFATVGVTWETGQTYADDELAVSVRSLDAGVWSPWQSVPYDAEHGPDPGSDEAQHQRFGTDPVVVGDVDDVQVRAVTSEGALPTDLTLDVIDPGESAVTREQPAIDTATLDGDDLAPVSAGTGSTDATVDDTALVGSPADVTPKPRIFSRKQWGADERMRDKGSLHYFEVHGGFVHHTVNANGYTRDQVPSILRGIYAYHTQSRGWSDIGYNFLVDRFGRIWEGRYGGVARPVVGAHTLNYNDYAFAMSAIGNFETARPGAAMIDAYGRLFAWKLSLHGIAAGDRKQRIGSTVFRAINGHRDAASTACPGRYLYAKLARIRAKAAAYQRPFAPRQKDSDLSGTRWPDLVVRDRDTKAVSIVRTGGQIGFEKRIVAAESWGGVDLQAVSRDLTGDGKADLVSRDRSTKVSSVRAGNGSGRFGTVVDTTTRFRELDQLVAVGDFNGDGNNDLVGRNGVGKRLNLIPGNGRGGFKANRMLAGSWAGYNLTTGAGDFDGDGAKDLLARDTDGRLWLVPGNGRGGLKARVQLSGNWARFGVISGLADVTNDGRSDIVARNRSSQITRFYPGDGAGGVTAPLGPFTRFKDVDFLASAGQVAGRNSADLIGRSAANRLVVFPNRGTRNLGATVSTGKSFTNTNAILSVGDWDGDGRNDVMTRRRSDGAMMFRAGAAGHTFAPAVVASTGWGKVGLLTAVGDLTGDGYPDVMGQPRGGAMRVYPGNGRSGFRTSFVARSAVSSNRQVGAGLWNADGSPDTIVRRSDGTVWVYAGNGPGGLSGGPQKIGSRARGYDWIIGAGDVDGNGETDLVARSSATGKLWLLPKGKGLSYNERRLIGTGFGGYDLVG